MKLAEEEVTSMKINATTICTSQKTLELTEATLRLFLVCLGVMLFCCLIVIITYTINEVLKIVHKWRG